MEFFRRPLFWAVAAGACLALFARRAGAFDPPRDPSLVPGAKSAPVVLEGRLDGPVRRTARGWRVRFAFDAPSGPQRAQLWIAKARPVADLRPGSPVRVRGKLRPPFAPRLKGGFDETAALAAQGCGWVLHGAGVEVLGPSPPAWRPWARAQDARLSASAAFARRLPPPRAALLSGLALGDAGGLPKDLARAVRDAGATHLLVASGSNVGFAAAAALLAGLALGLRPAPRLLGAVVAAGFYTLMAGADPPCVRAWVMLACASAARLAGRLTSASAALTLAAALMLLGDPASALSTSALMSFGACAALIAVGGAAEGALPEGWPRAARAAVALAAGSVAVSAALLPLWAEIFGRVSLAGPLTNLLLVPLSGPLLAGGFLLWAADAWCPAAAGPAASALDLGLGFFEGVCRAAAAAPWATVPVRPFSAVELAAWLAAWAAFLAWAARRERAVEGVLL